MVSVATQAADNDSLEYVGSYSSQRYTEEHYYLTEVWLWKAKTTYVGVLFIYGGLSGDGPVRPSAFKMDRIEGARGGMISFSAKSFSFVGRFEPDRIVGNLKNGSDSWDGAEGKTVLTAGTNIQTIVNRGATMSSYKEWLTWIDGLK